MSVIAEGSYAERQEGDGVSSDVDSSVLNESISKFRPFFISNPW